MTARQVAVLTVAIGGLLSARLPGAGANQQALRLVALTFDDLPYVAVNSSYLPSAQRATSSLLKILTKHRAPAIGFVNEAQLRGVDREARIALLDQWLDHGMLLGNHTFSHPDFNTVSIERFQDEILKGEVETRRLLAGKPRTRPFFRHPMTHTGDTKEKKEAIEKFLDARGYTIAPHTIENSDFIFNRVYVRALAVKDVALATKVRDTYLDFTIAATEFAEAISPKIFGREVAQTLLLHANDLNADSLDELLTRYENRGYRYITLEQAMADPAYRTPDTLVTTYGPTWLWRWMKSLGMNVSFAGDPEVPAWVTDLFNR
ncbi:MAG TPA: polysaccharide deacetylase family protein [Vicinamibacterales bacterium]|nr:polysaccharide deacetylase family protein [Vicinamibacterales bacterium]